MEEDILIGSLLGDGCIVKPRYNSCTYSEGHSTKQREYLLWKNTFLNFNYNEYKNTCQITKSNIIFSYYRKLFYPDNIKSVSLESLNKLTPRGLAIWYLDDGSYNYKSNNSKISTCCFNYKEHQLLQILLKEKFNLNSGIGSDNQEKKGYKVYYFLKFNSSNTLKLISIITPFVPKCMSYKLGLDLSKKKQASLTTKKYIINHREKFRQYTKKWALNNKDKIKAYVEKNRENRKLYFKEHFLKNKERYDNYQLDYISQPHVKEKRRKIALDYYYKKKKEKLLIP